MSNPEVVPPALATPHTEEAKPLSRTKGEDGLTPQERRFVEEFLVDLSSTNAAQRAGYGRGKRKSAREIGCLLRKKPRIAEAIGRALTERTGMTRAYVADELVKIATADISDFMDWDEHGEVRIKPKSEIDPTKFRAVVEVWRKADESVRVKLYDKLEALEMLARLLGIAPKDSAPVIATQVNIQLPDDVGGVLYGGRKDVNG